jgi:TonB-dependent SusC/RagA subfamily outer membrane receptor
VPHPSIKEEQEVRRFAGVDIVPTHAGFLVKIHSGAIGGGDPLYVIDGAPMKIPATRGIDWFKPEDIAEIKVLKYPYELAEYGQSGANGVIVITTKQNPARKR